MDKKPLAQDRPIILLPEALRNQIAAGEVVERPASALKELVENSLDAGADDIAVTLEDSGQSLLLVRDNGRGIGPEELELAVTRHATSKVASFTELLRVAGYGFRGEALASIASVSDLTVRSARPTAAGAKDLEGTFIRVRHGEIIGGGPCAMVPGTVVEVRELFANVPARLKFLKSPATELKRCKEHLFRLALAKPDVAFSLAVRGGGGHERELLRFDKGSDARLRLLQMLPAHVVEDLVPFQAQRDGLSVSGLACLPQHAQARGDRILLYVNKRPVNNRSLLQAVREAYKGRLTTREYPQVLLFLDMDPSEVDVNVHPAKSEVRFRDERAVFSAVLHALRSGLDKHQAAPPTSFFELAREPEQANLPSGSAWSPATNTPPVAAERDNRPWGFWGRADTPRLMDFPPLRDREADDEDERPTFVSETPGVYTVSRAASAPPVQIDPADSETGTGYPVQVDGFLCLGQVADSYLILLRDRSLFLVDQHAAHERVLLHGIERETESATSQLLALPMNLTLHPSESERLEELFPDLTRLGFALQSEAGRLTVSGVPPLLGRSRGLGFLRDLLAGRNDGINDIRHLMACHSAIKAGQKLAPDEAAELLRRWLRTPDYRFCPHGRPTVLEFDPPALEKLFKRKIY
ncbi:DNA mismatch repair endonuclease MutL [Desulfovibrio sp. OttesenSCG-928-F20]|nr:DNA mismatch repair endonuclease MutL [Desulfovibrio sp. OttesenSCG-928-F20]